MNLAPQHAMLNDEVEGAAIADRPLKAYAFLSFFGIGLR